MSTPFQRGGLLAKSLERMTFLAKEFQGFSWKKLHVLRIRPSVFLVQVICLFHE